MIQLIFHDQAGEPAATLQPTDLRVTGGVLWNLLDHGLIAHYANGCWKHRGQYYPTLSVTGGCCLLFGIARAPTLLTEPIGVFSMTGPTFRANGVAVAQYVEPQDMWQGLIRPFWWTAMRIISAASASALANESGIVLLNPWDPHPSEGAPSSN